MEPVPSSLKPAPPPLRAAGDEILATARSVLAAAPAREPTTLIHEFRVAMKRWRAWLRLVEPFVGNDARLLRREAAILTRGLGASRDVQAAIDAFDDIATAESSGTLAAPGRATRAAIEARLRSLRDEAEGRALDGATLARLQDAMERATTRISTWPLDAVDFDGIARGLAGSYRRCRAHVPTHWSEASDAELHELRKAVVILRYQLDIVAPLWPRMFRVLTSELQRLRTQLGKANDLAVLSTFAEPRKPLARWRTILAEHGTLRQQRHRRRAREIAGRSFAETPRAFRRKLLALWQAAQVE